MTENKAANKMTTACKLVEVGDNGELKILKENLDKLLSHFREAEGVCDIPIAVVSVLGPHLSGKSFFTNLLMEYLKHDGGAWTKSMRESGLKGFSYGAADNRVSDNEMEKSGSGVYFWPEVFTLKQHSSSEKKILLLVMDVHRKRESEEKLEKVGPEADLLDLFAAVSSSRIAEIVSLDKKGLTEMLHNDESAEVKSLVRRHMCQSIVYLERKTKDAKGSSRKGNTVPILEYLKPFHDKRGIVQFTLPQKGVVEKFMRAIIEETELHPKIFEKDGLVLKVGLIDKFLEYFVQLINSRGTCSIQETTNDLDENTIPPPLPLGTEGGNCDNLENNIQIEENEKNVLNSDSDNKKNNSPTPATTETDLIQFPDSKINELESYKQNLACCSIWPNLHGSLTTWINKNLERGNIGEVKTLFETFLRNLMIQDVDKLKKMGMPEAESLQFIENIRKNEIEDGKFQSFFLAVEKGLQAFCKKLEDEFSKTPFFPPEILKPFCKATVESFYRSIGSNANKELFEMGVLKLIPFYESYNHKMRNMSMECIHQIRNFYKEEMTKIVPRGRFQSPKKLVQIHGKLILELKDVYQKSMYTSTTADLSQQLTDLERQLNSDFVEHERRNMRLIEVAMKNINRLILKWKSEYEVMMEQLLEESPDGLEPMLFDAKCDAIEGKIVNQFKEETVPKLYNVASINKYLQTLSKYIEDAKEEIKKENEDKWKNTKEKSMQYQAKPGPSRSSGSVCTNMKQTPSGRPTQESDRNEKTLLLIQIGLEKIGVAIMKNNSIQKLEYLLPEIGLTKNEEWVCGKELETLIESNNQHVLQKQWHIGKNLLLKGQQQAILERVAVGYIDLAIRTEFLLALFFRSIKQEVEIEQRESIIDAMITVPFWCPSVQRQMVLDAAQIAGFANSNVELFSENTAAAYYMYESGKHEEKYPTLVLSENSDQLDIALYYYEKGQLSMLSHCGECETNKFFSTGNYGWISSIYSFLKSAGEKYTLKDEERIMRKIYFMCDKAIDRADRLHPKFQSPCRKILICCQSDRLTRLLREVAKRFVNSGNSTFVTVENRAPIHGLASIHKVVNGNGMAVDNIIKEGMPFYVNIFNPSGKERCVAFVKKETFSFYPKSFHGTASFPKMDGLYTIVQQNVVTESRIAQLFIDFNGTNNVGYAITLKRSQQGIISLEKIECTHALTFSKWPKRTQMKHTAYDWRSVNISNKIKNTYSVLMDQIRFYSSLAIRLAEEKQQILDTLACILNAIKEGKGVFQNSVQKALVFKQLEESQEQLKNSPKIKEDEIKQQGGFLKSIVEKYKLE